MTARLPKSILQLRLTPSQSARNSVTTRPWELRAPNQKTVERGHEPGLPYPRFSLPRSRPSKTQGAAALPEASALSVWLVDLACRHDH